MKKIYIAVVLFFASCTSPRVSITNIKSSDSAIINGKIFATAWQQRSAEYKALCYQAFNIARGRIEQFNRERSPKPKPDKPELNRKTFNFPILWNHLLKDIAKKSAAYLVVTTA